MARAPVLCPTQRERWSRAWAGRPPAQGRQPPGVGADADAGRWAQTRALRRLISSGSCVLSCVLCSWRDASLVRVQRLHPNELVAAAGAPAPTACPPALPGAWLCSCSESQIRPTLPRGPVPSAPLPGLRGVGGGARGGGVQAQDAQTPSSPQRRPWAFQVFVSLRLRRSLTPSPLWEFNLLP